MQKLNLLLISLFLLLFAGCGTGVAIVPDTMKINTSRENPLDISVIHKFQESVSFFLSKVLQNTTLTHNIVYGDTVLYVNDTTNCYVDDVVNVIDDNNYYQGYILEVTPTSLSVVGEFTQEFNIINTKIECGEWNIAESDGSINEELFSITPPINQSWHIMTNIIKLTDNSDWDLSGFGGGSRLDNGFSSRISDGYIKDLFTIMDNSDFKMRGFHLENFAKAPSGVYGFTGTLYFQEIFGSILELDGNMGDTFSVVNRADLTDRTEIAISINGHIAKK